jgi:hypothetical protein
MLLFFLVVRSTLPVNLGDMPLLLRSYMLGRPKALHIPYRLFAENLHKFSAPEILKTSVYMCVGGSHEDDVSVPLPS